jgi:hypothetical protein
MRTSLSLDALGQHTLLYKLYTQISCIFPVSHHSRQDDFVRTLQLGLERLSAAFPWIAGNVIYDDLNEEYRIVPSGAIPLIIHDIQHDASAPTMNGLRKAAFPCGMLDEKAIAPCLTINASATDEGLKACSAPVLALQANFITDGLILTIVAQHNVTDMTGQDHIIALLSKACHGIPFTEQEEAVGMMDRSRVIPLLPESYDIWNPGPELDFQVHKPRQTESAASTDSDLPAATWACVNFPKSSLEQLKSWATMIKDSSVPFVSTDDTVCAFLWKCISRVRLSRLDPKLISTISRAVDIRDRMGVPSSYLGMLQSLTFARRSLQQVVDEPLGTIASYLRSLLDPDVIDLVYQARAFNTFVARAGEKKCTASFTANMSPTSDLMTSSWSKIRCYEYDFNLGLGKPEAVRRPGFSAFECLVYFMPRSPRGELIVQICLRDEDWDRLKEDEEFTTFARYIG